MLGGRKAKYKVDKKIMSEAASINSQRLSQLVKLEILTDDDAPEEGLPTKIELVPTSRARISQLPHLKKSFVLAQISALEEKDAKLLLDALS